ncbi:MAG: ATP-dependent helicase, partial [Gemmatimonadaceae bacterium]|nr:ATP-dependent helicase [Chitinophagaceae bacterium]
SYKSDLMTVVLTNNYRSTQPILNASKNLISRNLDRLTNQLPDLSKELLSSHPERMHLTHLPVVKEYETERDEMIDITLQTEQLLANGMKPGSIGIIYKENKYGQELARYFQLRKIPVYSKRNLDILTIPLAQQCILLMEYLASEHDVPYGGDEMLFEILHFEWFKIPPVEIARLSVEVAERQFSENKTSLRSLLYEKATKPPKDLFDKGLHENLRSVHVILEKLVGNVANMTVQQLFESIIREAGVLKHIMQSDEKLWMLQILNGLFDFIKEETRRQPYMDLEALMDVLRLMKSEAISLPLVQVSGTDKGVNLLTVHGSKGLEFSYVFFAGCNASSWEKKRKPHGGYSMPDTIFSSNTDAKDNEELRRLFYVALTRAEQHLYISYSKYLPNGKESEPSRFIAEVLDGTEMRVVPQLIPTETLQEFYTLHFKDAQAPEIEKLEEAFLDRLLEKFVMNVTALNNYLTCPLEFYFKNLIRIPSPKNEATEFGSAVHHALEQLFRKMQDNNGNQFPSKQDFINDYDWYIHRHRESFTKEQFNRRLEYGHEVLSNYYNKYINEWNRIVAIERNIRNVTVGGVPLKGKLDKLEFDGKSVNVVDYKTGDPDKGKAKMKPPDGKDPNGGNYWRQAVFYKILVDNYGQKDWQVVSSEFDFIEPDKKKNYKKEKIVISPADIATVTDQIKTVWEKIEKRDFYTGCGKEDCHWCAFVKTNNLAVTLHDLHEEEEETNY